MIIKSAPDYLAADTLSMVTAWESDHYSTLPVMAQPRKLFIRLHLITEEFAELVAGFNTGDRVDILDALGDLDVVVTGTWLVNGQKRTPWANVDVPEVLVGLPLPGDRDTADMFIQFLSLLSKLSQAFAEEDLVKTYVYLSDMDDVLTKLWAKFGMLGVREETSAEILRSNLSKLGPDGKVIKSVAGRVLKGPNYSKPDLGAILTKYLLSQSDGLSDGEAPCSCGGCADPFPAEDVFVG